MFFVMSFITCSREWAVLRLSSILTWKQNYEKIWKFLICWRNTSKLSIFSMTANHIHGRVEAEVPTPKKEWSKVRVRTFRDTIGFLIWKIFVIRLLWSQFSKSLHGPFLWHIGNGQTRQCIEIAATTSTVAHERLVRALWKRFFNIFNKSSQTMLLLTSAGFF